MTVPVPVLGSTSDNISNQQAQQGYYSSTNSFLPQVCRCRPEGVRLRIMRDFSMANGCFGVVIVDQQKGGKRELFQRAFQTILLGGMGINRKVLVASLQRDPALKPRLQPEPENPQLIVNNQFNYR